MNDEMKPDMDSDVEAACETLMKAEAIKADHELHAKAMEHMGKKSMHMKAAMKSKKPKSLQDLKDMANKKEME